jgi:hypothetical protein
MPLPSRKPSPLIAAAAAVLAADMAGFVVATATGLAGVTTAIISGTSINAPAPFVVVQMTVVSVAAAYRGRPGGTVAAGLLVPLCLVSICSGFTDGSFGDSALNGGDVAVQVWIVVATAALGALAARQVAAAARGRSPGRAAA